MYIKSTEIYISPATQKVFVKKFHHFLHNETFVSSARNYCFTARKRLFLAGETFSACSGKIKNRRCSSVCAVSYDRDGYFGPLASGFPERPHPAVGTDALEHKKGIVTHSLQTGFKQIRLFLPPDGGIKIDQIRTRHLRQCFWQQITVCPHTQVGRTARRLLECHARNGSERHAAFSNAMRATEANSGTGSKTMQRTSEA